MASAIIWLVCRKTGICRRCLIG
uniref:Uncharacterized protein n=1 Tax=Arundo donax TaxID=35708 RepID=A0A0A9BQ56_ARUDO